MRFGFDSTETNDDVNNARQPLTSPSPSTSTPKEDLQWFPLQHHPLFSAVDGGGGRGDAALLSSTSKMPTNLLAWDGASRLYFWDSNKRCLHRISIRLDEPDPSSILAASPAKVLQADDDLNFEVYKISINRNGSALLLLGLEGLCVMYLYGRSSMKENTIICRTISIGSEIYFNRNSVIRTLQISWHPYSDTHLGVLSSDSVFRIFNLSSDVEQPEQEYYLQPVEPGSSHKAASICPVGFSFGGDHLWDRFSVFLLYSDGSVYVLCPVVPFGSVYKWESLLELYSDAQTFGLKSSHPKAVNNSNLAISWLEGTFPELGREAEGGNLFALKAQPYALFDASLILQGPLRKLCRVEEEADFDVQATVCEGRAVSLLYNLVSKDSILVTAWSGGQLQIDALADEIQPVWKAGIRPRLCVDSYDHVTGVAMICESVSSDLSMLKLDQAPDGSLWLGHPPPLLRLAIVDLALPGKSGSLISMFVDPLIPERIYCLHVGGIDSVILHFLPFTNQTSGKGDKIRTPSVDPVLSTCQGETSSSSSICGFHALSDSFGDSWIVGLTCFRECTVLEMKTWNSVPLLDKEKKSTRSQDSKEMDNGTIISKELLSGPKVVLLPAAPNLRSVAADTIEGRSALHQYFKLFHENYVEYAHKVYFELQHHAPRLKEIIDDLHSRLRKAQQRLSEVEEKRAEIEGRINRAEQSHSTLEARLQNLRNLPGARRKPLSKAEKEFKSELDRFTGMELYALWSSIEALDARLKKRVLSSPAKLSDHQRQVSARRKNLVQENEMAQLRSSIKRLSLVNNENTKKVKVIESALKSRGIDH